MGAKHSAESKIRSQEIEAAINDWNSKPVEEIIAKIKDEQEKGTDLNMNLTSGRTPLTFLCSLDCKDEDKDQKRLQLIQTLILHGASVNTKDRIGDTPLIVAAKSDDTDIIFALLSNGANTYDENKHSNNASQVGSAIGTKTIEDWLLKSSQEIAAMFKRLMEMQDAMTKENIKPFIEDKLGWIRYLPEEKQDKYQKLRQSLKLGRSNLRGSIKIDGRLLIDNEENRDDAATAGDMVHVTRRLLHQADHMALDSIKIDVGNKHRTFKLENLQFYKSLFTTRREKKTIKGEEYIQELLMKFNLTEEDRIPILTVFCNSAWIDDARQTPDQLLHELILPSVLRIFSFERLPSWYEKALIDWMSEKMRTSQS